MKRLVSLAFAFFFLPASAFATDMRSVTVGPVHFQIPADWEENSLPALTTVSFAPPRPDEMVDTRTFPARIWVAVERASVPLEGEKLKNYFIGQSTIDGSSTDWYRSNFALTSSRDVSFLGKSGMRFEYTSDWSSIPVRGVSILTVTEGKIIEATMYAPPGNFETYAPVFEAVVASVAYVGDQAPVRHGQSKAPAARSSVGSASSASSASSRARKPLRAPRVRQSKRGSSASSSARSVRGR